MPANKNQVFFYGKDKMNSIRFDAVTSTSFFQYHPNEPTLIITAGGHEQLLDTEHCSPQEQKQFMEEYRGWLGEDIDSVSQEPICKWKSSPRDDSWNSWETGCESWFSYSTKRSINDLLYCFNCGKKICK